MCGTQPHTPQIQRGGEQWLPVISSVEGEPMSALPQLAWHDLGISALGSQKQS
jgi:hypothetical protein